MEPADNYAAGPRIGQPTAEVHDPWAIEAAAKGAALIPGDHDPFAGANPFGDFRQGPTIGKVDEPPYYAEGASDIANTIANREASRLLASRGAGRTPEDIETARSRAATAAMFASPEAGLLQGLNEGAHTGDYSGAVAPAISMVAGPLAGKVISAAGPRAAKTAGGVLSALAPSTTESAAADQPEQAAAANKEAAVNPPKLILSPEDADKAQKQELATLQDQRRAIVEAFNQRRADLLKQQPQMATYGLSNPADLQSRTQRLGAKAQDAAKLAEYNKDKAAYDASATALGTAQDTALKAVARALRAARAAGFESVRVEIDREGRIAIVAGAGKAEEVASENPLDKWIADYARQAQGN